MWMAVMGIGAVIGLAALGGIVWALRKLPAPKKWGALVGFLVLGAAGAFMVANATALAGPDVEDEVAPMEDFDAPLDDDWGDDWPEDEAGDEAAEGAEGTDDGWDDEPGDETAETGEAAE